MENRRVAGIEALANAFGDRFRQNTNEGPGVAVSVLPADTEEVRALAGIAANHGLTLVAVGAGTAPEGTTREAADGGVLVRFDLMRGIRLPEDPEASWAEAEPGALWLQMDNELRLRGKGLAVYPTSAPRATVGGWLVTDGLGVGSFEYGRIRENVLSAKVTLPGGTIREVEGEELGNFLDPRTGTGIVVGARLRTRRADADVPFAAAFTGPAAQENIVATVADLVSSSPALWHLAFLSPAMASARGLGDEHLLFGAYPDARKQEVETDLRRPVEANGGRFLDAASAHRCWGERFYPVAPSRPTPRITRDFIPLRGLRQALDARPDAAVQCTVSRSGEMLMLTLDTKDTATTS